MPPTRRTTSWATPPYSAPRARCGRAYCGCSSRRVRNVCAQRVHSTCTVRSTHAVGVGVRVCSAREAHARHMHVHQYMRGRHAPPAAAPRRTASSVTSCRSWPRAVTRAATHSSAQPTTSSTSPPNTSASSSKPPQKHQQQQPQRSERRVQPAAAAAARIPGFVKGEPCPVPLRLESGTLSVIFSGCHSGCLLFVRSLTVGNRAHGKLRRCSLALGGARRTLLVCTR